MTKKKSDSEKLTEKKQTDSTAAKEQAPSQESPSGVCPEGARFAPNPRRCVTQGGFVLGPFPLELQELCREQFPSDAGTCVQKQDWPADFFFRFQPLMKNGCPPGTDSMAEAGCLSSGVVYGPFTSRQANSCRAKLKGAEQAQCEQMAWPLEVFKQVQVEAEVKKIIVVDELQDNVGVQSSEPTPLATPSPTPSPTPLAIPSPTPSPTPLAIPAPSQSPKPNQTSDGQSLNSTPGAGSSQSARTSAAEQSETQVRAPSFCMYSWDERPGTADFTTRNQRLLSLSRPVTYWLDRDEKDSLLQSNEFQNMDTCTRARFLKKCFQRVILDSDSPSAQAFRAWSLGRVRPVEAHMAFVMKETRLGLWPDTCWKGQCKGVGISRVTRARTTAGKDLVDSDPLWQGITHNIITGLDFGLRLIAEKTKSGPTDLYSLAYLHERRPRFKERYAMDVDRYYKELLSCQLDEP